MLRAGREHLEGFQAVIAQQAAPALNALQRKQRIGSGVRLVIVTIGSIFKI